MIWPKGKTHFPKTRAKIAAAKRGKTNIPELRGATDAQRADFKLFRAKGYSRQEAIALAMGATA